MSQLTFRLVTGLVALVVVSAAGRGQVLTGLDVLEKDGFAELQGRKVAIVTNQTGLDRQGRHIVELLTHAKGVTVVKLFSPEHGLYGVKDERVGDMVDEKSGLPVVSLYGKARKPTAEMLKGVDTLVFDIQDVGARFYTYSATLGLCLEAAGENHIRYVVLDRPNPTSGKIVDGPIEDKEYVGRFTAFGPIPVAHGMTFGELASLYNGEYGIHAELQVIKMEGWRRDMWWSDTGLPWTNPSPAMRTPTAALLYPGVCLFEATNVSVGRGTDVPFECIGAPYADARQLADSLNGQKLPGLYFTPMEFTPTYRTDKGKACHGVRIEVTDREKVRPVEAGMTMVWTINKLYGEQFNHEKVVNLLMNKSVLAGTLELDNPQEVGKLWAGEVEKFKAIRAKYLLYP